MRPTRARDLLYAPVDISWLVCLRIGFGALMIWHAVSYLAEGRVRRFWIEPDFHFKFPGFEWVVPWAGEGMIVHFWVLAILAFFVAIGFRYRISAALFFVAFAYGFLLEQARYQNHTYLICLLAFLAIFLPANRAVSVDARLRPSLRSETVPAWALSLMRFQVGVPYFYGAIAKLNGDWFRGEPLREWLPHESDLPLLGQHFDEEWAVYAFSYGGLLIDLVAVPFLLWRPTRFGMFVVLFLFHCCNSRLFTLGVFPWMMIVLTTVFLDPDWPRRICRDLVDRNRRGVAAVVGAVLGWSIAVWFNGLIEFAASLAGTVGGAFIGWQLVARSSAATAEAPDGAEPETRPRLVAACLGAWVLIQLLVPLRHFAIPGNVAWTAEGQRFSWHMKLNDTDGRVVFRVVDTTTGDQVEVDPVQTLTHWQVGRIDGRPHMIRQYARHLAAEAGREGREVRVYADAWLSLNNRPMQRIIDPDVDLARAPAATGFSSAPWILPLMVGR